MALELVGAAERSLAGVKAQSWNLTVGIALDGGWADSGEHSTLSEKLVDGQTIRKDF